MTLLITDLFAKTSEMELKDFDGNGTGITVKLVGQDSRQFKEGELKMARYIGKKPAEITEEEVKSIMKIKLDTAISLIVGWSNDTAFGGAYSVELAQSTFAQPEAAILLSQIEAYVGERANFFRTSKAATE